jgi:imidazole glycerol-phosphate synthase subunit HisH
VSPAPEIVLIDFGMGNLRSVARSLERAGGKPRVSRDPAEVLRAGRVVVPGVGAMGAAMDALRRDGLDTALCERIRAGRPFLGICLGMQVLLDSSEEGEAKGLGVIPGRVARFAPAPGRPVPHMGWNSVVPARHHELIAADHFYFVHGYRPTQVPERYALARTEYGETFPSAIGFDACAAIQFHPEKSQRAGLALLERFCAWAP